MTLSELRKMTDSPIKVIDTENQRVLCFSYEPERYPGLSSRPVHRIRADADKSKGVRSEWFHAVLYAEV